MELTKKREKELMEKYLTSCKFKKVSGYAINTQEMNPEDYDEIFFQGEDLQKAIEDYWRKVDEYWIYEPSDGEQIFEDINDAIEYAEESLDVSFDDFVKAETPTKKQ